MKKRKALIKTLSFAFSIGVNVIGLPELIFHKGKLLCKERNIRQRYTY